MNQNRVPPNIRPSGRQRQGENRLPAVGKTPDGRHEPKEFKLTALRSCPTPDEMQLCDSPEKAASYWRAHVPSQPYFNPAVECFVALLLNTRRRILGHYLISVGGLNSCPAAPREVFRPALVGGAAAIIVMHNHPSGDASPSATDIEVTRTLRDAGKLLNIELLDHVIMGAPKAPGSKDYSSFVECGYLDTSAAPAITAAPKAAPTSPADAAPVRDRKRWHYRDNYVDLEANSIPAHDRLGCAVTHALALMDMLRDRVEELERCNENGLTSFGRCCFAGLLSLANTASLNLHKLFHDAYEEWEAKPLSIGAAK